MSIRRCSLLPSPLSVSGSSLPPITPKKVIVNASSSARSSSVRRPVWASTRAAHTKIPSPAAWSGITFFPPSGDVYHAAKTKKADAHHKLYLRFAKAITLFPFLRQSPVLPLRRLQTTLAALFILYSRLLAKRVKRSGLNSSGRNSGPLAGGFTSQRSSVSA